MVFSTETILNAISKNNDEYITTKNISNEHSFFIETLQILLQEDIQFQISMNRSGIESINESYTSDILKSVIKKIDFKKIIINLLKKFIEIIDRLGKEVEVFVMNLINKNSVIKHYKKELENFDQSVYFKDTRYIYTNLGLNTSYTSFKSELNKEFSTLILELTKLGKFKLYEEFYEIIDRIMNEDNSIESYTDNLRGNILGVSSPIRKEDFPKEAFNYFRNNGIEIGASTVTFNEIRKTCMDYFDYSKNIKMIQKDKNDMKQESINIQKEIGNLKLEDFIKDNLPPSSGTYFSKLLNNRCIRIKELCNIYLQLFSIKLDTVKEAHLQNTKILLEACKVIIRGGQSDGN